MLDGLRGAAFFCFDSKYELARHIQNQIERSAYKVVLLAQKAWAQTQLKISHPAY